MLSRSIAATALALSLIACSPEAQAPLPASPAPATLPEPSAPQTAPAAAVTIPASFTVRDGVVYRPLGGRDVTGGFALFEAGAEAVTVVGARAAFAGTVELHTHTMGEGGKMAMRRVESFPVEAGGTRELRRGGDHLMFFGVSPDLPAKGEAVDIVLTLQRADGSTFEHTAQFTVVEHE